MMLVLTFLRSSSCWGDLGIEFSLKPDCLFPSPKWKCDHLHGFI